MRKIIEMLRASFKKEELSPEQKRRILERMCSKAPDLGIPTWICPYCESGNISVGSRCWYCKRPKDIDSE